ncbi:hypothetical protein FHG87_013926 [Trinorchestia longiramus]|nr:hypothetical protein FHG87_013926 [Trinorchestia longiramus]
MRIKEVERSHKGFVQLLPVLQLLQVPLKLEAAAAAAAITHEAAAVHVPSLCSYRSGESCAVMVVVVW